MRERHGNSIFAFALIAIGILLVLQNFNFPMVNNISIGNIIGIFWPIFLLVPGLNMLRHRPNIGGIILTFIGASFLLENLLELIGINFSIGFIFKFFWPAILIYIGFKILKPTNKKKMDEDFGDEFQRREEAELYNITFNSKSFKYDSLNTPLGISKLTLNISFGGAEIYIEEGIQVILLGQCVLGGYEFFGMDGGGIHSDIKEVRYSEDEDHLFDRTIIIKTNITFGGIEVK